MVNVYQNTRRSVSDQEFSKQRKSAVGADKCFPLYYVDLTPLLLISAGILYSLSPLDLQMCGVQYY